LFKIEIPWLLTNIAPIIPVNIIIKIVFHKPIYFPIILKKQEFNKNICKELYLL